jgi:hypothetical protein
MTRCLQLRSHSVRSGNLSIHLQYSTNYHHLSRNLLSFHRLRTYKYQDVGRLYQHQLFCSWAPAMDSFISHVSLPLFLWRVILTGAVHGNDKVMQQGQRHEDVTPPDTPCMTIEPRQEARFQAFHVMRHPHEPYLNHNLEAPPISMRFSSLQETLDQKEIKRRKTDYAVLTFINHAGLLHLPFLVQDLLNVIANFPPKRCPTIWQDYLWTQRQAKFYFASWLHMRKLSSEPICPSSSSIYTS